MDEPKISVIVPVYNVEPYLRKCLDSIVNQTYRNLEIILVDDGSPDHCGAICDEYAEKDSRIVVIHKENGGVSSARNAGLAAVTGEWIGWVDPDDWIEADMFSCLIEGTLEMYVDIVVCGRYEEYEGYTTERVWKNREMLGRHEAIKKLLENDLMQNFLWDKLWKKELFCGIWFPEGRTYEDIAVMHRLFERTATVCCLPVSKYHYFQRRNSIVSNVSLKNRINHYLAAKERYYEMKDAWPEFQNLLEAQCVASAVGIWTSYLKNPYEDRRTCRDQLQEISEFAGEHYKSALKHMRLGPTGRAVICLTPHPNTWAFVLSLIFSWAYKMKHGREL